MVPDSWNPFPVGVRWAVGRGASIASRAVSTAPAPGVPGGGTPRRPRPAPGVCGSVAPLGGRATAHAPEIAAEPYGSASL